MERDKPVIRLPATFTCSMTGAEAVSRIAAAKRHPGVTFILEDTTTDDKRIVGRTIVTNLHSFDEFNEEVFPDSVRKHSGGRKPFS